MNSISKTVLIGTLILGASANHAVAAESSRTDGINPYIGGNIGRVDINADEFDNDTDTSMSIYAGVDLNKNFGVEVGYVNLGETENDFFTAGLEGIEVAALAHIINVDYFDLFVKGGVIGWKSEIDSTLVNTSNTGGELFWGVGSNVYLTDSIALTVDYTRYKVELQDDELGQLVSGSEFDLNRLSAGARYTF